jgi:hypothetical protein
MIAEDYVKRFPLRGGCAGRFRGNLHFSGCSRSTSPDELSFDFHHASVTCLNGAHLRVITNLRQFGASAIDHINQEFTGSCFVNRSVNRYSESHRTSPINMMPSDARRSRLPIHLATSASFGWKSSPV